ncbi:HNH endonuclease [Aeromonas allosaccharophila]|uniref:HNH endonuclease n=1 Tax=Aeromonas allosaccharophila TaxID=656 RepID=UPI003D21BF2D
MSWADDLVQAFENLGGQAELADIYDEIEKIRLNLTPAWKSSVRERIQRHSSDSAAYNEKNPDLFYSLEGLGNGVWGLRSKVATTPLATDLNSGEENPSVSPQVIYRILRDSTLAIKIKLLHSNTCQICRTTIELQNGQLYSEAHHIIPLGSPHNGPDTPGNMLVLCPNCHVLCDYGGIELNSSKIKSIDGHAVSEESIEYHNSAIFNRKL